MAFPPPLPLPGPPLEDRNAQEKFDTISRAWPGRGPHVELTRVAAVQAVVTATVTPIAWDTILNNDFSMWAVGAPTVVTIPKTGRYVVEANCEWAAVAAGVRNLYVTVSTSTAALPRSVATFSPGNAAAPLEQNVCAPIYMPAGTTLVTNVWQTSGANLNVGGAPLSFGGVGTNMRVSWLGE